MSRAAYASCQPCCLRHLISRRIFARLHADAVRPSFLLHFLAKFQRRFAVILSYFRLMSFVACPSLSFRATSATPERRAMLLISPLRTPLADMAAAAFFFFFFFPMPILIFEMLFRSSSFFGYFRPPPTPLVFAHHFAEVRWLRRSIRKSAQNI